MAKLHRKDLAQEFSDIVNQEIKNHNDLLLSTNMSLEKMKFDIAETSFDCNKKYKELIDKFISHTDSIDLIKRSIVEGIEKCRRDLNDRYAENKSDLISLRKSIDDRESYFLTISGFDEFKKKIEEWVSHIQRAFNVQKDTFTQSIFKLIEKSEDSIDQVQKKIQKNIDEVIQGQRDQEKNFDIFALNFESLKKEISVLKKRCFVIEKNIENLYTQIERLKVAQ